MGGMSEAAAPLLLPLSGLHVLEFTQNIMGPSAGLVLADLGADVVKAEPAPGGDPTRRLSGFAAGFFGYFNRNKAQPRRRPQAAGGAGAGAAAGGRGRCGDRELCARHHGPAGLRLRGTECRQSAPRLLRTQRLSLRAPRASARARRSPARPWRGRPPYPAPR